MKIEIENGKNNNADARSFEAFADDGMRAGEISFERAGEERCELKRLYVEMMYRGEGIGKKLLKTLIEAARDDWYKEIIAYTKRDMFELNILLQSFGFVETNSEEISTVPGSNLLLLKL